MTDLKIPDVVYDVGERALHGYPFAEVDYLDAASDVINNVAPLIVAAELTRLAKELLPEESPNVMWRAISRRAVELDPKGLTH
jgi:hypothetical protein